MTVSGFNVWAEVSVAKWSGHGFESNLGYFLLILLRGNLGFGQELSYIRAYLELNWGLIWA